MLGTPQLAASLPPDVGCWALLKHARQPDNVRSRGVKGTFVRADDVRTISKKRSRTFVVALKQLAPHARK